MSAVKSAGKNWKVGGTGSGQEDSVLTAMMEAEFGYKVTYIPFPAVEQLPKTWLVSKLTQLLTTRQSKWPSTKLATLSRLSVYW